MQALQYTKGDPEGPWAQQHLEGLEHQRDLEGLEGQLDLEDRQHQQFQHRPPEGLLGQPEGP
jgi:hypothetical protein